MICRHCLRASRTANAASAAGGRGRPLGGCSPRRAPGVGLTRDLARHFLDAISIGRRGRQCRVQIRKLGSKAIALPIHVAELVAKAEPLLLSQAVAPPFTRLVHLLDLFANSIAIPRHRLDRIARCRVALEIARLLLHAVGVLVALPNVRMPRRRSLWAALARPLPCDWTAAGALAPAAAASLVAGRQAWRRRDQRGSDKSNE